MLTRAAGEAVRMDEFRANCPATNLMFSRVQGFSLLEVLIITGLAMLLAAALVPRLLNSRIAANEATAVANVDIITSAQTSYKMAYPAIGYADSLSRLAAICHERECKPTPEHACLIDCNLPGAALHAQNGYLYGLAAASPAGSGPNSTYVVAATAEKIHHTGDHDFCAVEDARIRWQAPASSTPATSLTHSRCQRLAVMP